MTRDELAAVLTEELARIAPEIDFGDADPTADLREAFDIDSMDILNLVTALHERLGLDIPETDYGRLATITDALDYLAGRMSEEA
jgi:acyl carrier protein